MHRKYVFLAVISVAALVAGGSAVASGNKNSQTIVESLAVPELTPHTLVKNEPMAISVTFPIERSDDYRKVFLQAERINQKGKSKWATVGQISNRRNDSSEFWFLDTGEKTFTAKKYWFYDKLNIPWKHKRFSNRGNSPMQLRIYALSRSDKKLAYVSPAFSLDFLDIVLPPDPGDEGKQTIEGIDSDGDGVRDDVQRHITITYPDSERIRAPLLQYAFIEQVALLTDSTDEAEVLSVTDVRHGAIYCLWLLHGSEAPGLYSAIHSELINTETRLEAYSRFDSVLEGRIFELPPNVESVTWCSFDPNLLEN